MVGSWTSDLTIVTPSKGLSGVRLVQLPADGLIGTRLLNSVERRSQRNDTFSTRVILLLVERLMAHRVLFGAKSAECCIQLIAFIGRASTTRISPIR